METRWKLEKKLEKKLENWKPENPKRVVILSQAKNPSEYSLQFKRRVDPAGFYASLRMTCKGGMLTAL